jgi:hypothetical protein
MPRHWVVVVVIIVILRELIRPVFPSFVDVSSPGGCSSSSSDNDDVMTLI